MPELPYIKWFSNDWMGDPKVRSCSPATRGIWFDFINLMHLLGRTGKLMGTREQLARLATCSAAELDQALIEITSSQVGSVSERNGVVTVINRRMSREHDLRIKDAIRKSNARQTNGVHAQSGPPSEPCPPNTIASSCSDGFSSSLREGGLGETPLPLTPDDLAEIGEWFTRVPKVSQSQKLRDAVLKNHYTLDQLKSLWVQVTNTRGVKNRPAFFTSQVFNGVRVNP